MEKRRHNRMQVDNLTVDISDGSGFFAGTVSDLSRFGLQLNNVPKRLDECAKQLFLIITGKGKHFKLKARPRWAVRQSIGKKVGIEILSVPMGWTEFVMTQEPAADSSWEEITL